METKVNIKKRTMDFAGGIVPLGARYYEVRIKESGLARTECFCSAQKVPIEDYIKDYGIDSVGWPYKTRDLNPKHKGARSQLSRRVLAIKTKPINFRLAIKNQMKKQGINSGYALAKEIRFAITTTAIDNYLNAKSEMTAANLEIILNYFGGRLEF